MGLFGRKKPKENKDTKKQKLSLGSKKEKNKDNISEPTSKSDKQKNKKDKNNLQVKQKSRRKEPEINTVNIEKVKEDIKLSHIKEDPKTDNLGIDLESLEARLFLYAQPTYYGKIHAFFETYESVLCLGTTIKSDLIKEYSLTGNTINNIILFILDKSDIDPCVALLKSIGLEFMPENSLNIFLVIDDKIKTIAYNEIKVIKNISKFSYQLTLKEIKFMKSLCKSIITKIIENQPTHIDDTIPPLPQKAIYEEDKPKVDLGIINLLEEARKTPIKERYQKDDLSRLKSSVLGARNLEESISAFETQNDVLTNFTKIDEEIKSFLENRESLPDDEVINIIKARIFATTLAANEVQELAELISTETLNSISQIQDDITEFNTRNLYQHQDNIKDLLSTRQDLREQLEIFYNKHCELALVVERTIKTSKATLDMLDNKVTESLDIVLENPSVTSMAKQSVDIIRSYKTDFEKTAKMNIETLRKTYDFANKLLGESKKLIEMDDLIIDTFDTYINDMQVALESNKVVKAETKRKCGDLLRVIYNTPKAGLRTILNILKENNSIILNLNKTNRLHTTQYDNVLEVDYINFINQPIDDFINKGSIVVNVDLRENIDNELFISLLDYLSDSFTRIYTVIETLDNDTNSYPLEEMLLTITNRVYLFTDIKLLEETNNITNLNKTYNKISKSNYTNILSKKIIFNKYLKSNENILLLDKTKSLLGLDSKCGQIFIPHEINLDRDMGNYNVSMHLATILNNQLKPVI